LAGLQVDAIERQIAVVDERMAAGARLVLVAAEKAHGLSIDDPHVALAEHGGNEMPLLENHAQLAGVDVDVADRKILVAIIPEGVAPIGRQIDSRRGGDQQVVVARPSETAHLGRACIEFEHRGAVDGQAHGVAIFAFDEDQANACA